MPPGRGDERDGAVVGAGLRRLGLFLLLPPLRHGGQSSSINVLRRPVGALPHQTPRGDDRADLNMLPKVLADAVLFSHFLFILFALFGGLLVLYRRWFLWLHMPVVLWSAVVNLAGWICPLTPLENSFRAAAGQAGYKGGFIEHYIGSLVYPGGMTRDLELIAGVSVLVWNVLVYFFVILRKRHER